MQFTNNCAIYSGSMYYDKNIENSAKKGTCNKDLKSKSCDLPSRKSVGKIKSYV